jgi:hypothetical protein
MKCSQAQVMMQRRLDAGESVAGESAAGEEFAALDAHLRECSACSMAWLELLRSRALLGVVRSDAPTNEEVESMWQAIDASVATAGGMLNSANTEDVAETARRRERWLRLFAPIAGVAACLLIAFFLGEQRYGDVRVGDEMAGVRLAERGTLAYSADDRDERLAAQWMFKGRDDDPNERAMPIHARRRLQAVQDHDFAPSEYFSPSAGRSLQSVAHGFGVSDVFTQARADSGAPFTPTTEADDFSGEVTAVHGAQAGRRDYVEGSDGSQITLGKPLALAERPRLDALGYSTGYPQTSVGTPIAAGDAEVESVAPVVAGEQFRAYADSDMVAGAQIAQVGDEIGRAGNFVVRSESQSPEQEDAVVSRGRLEMDDAPEPAPGEGERFVAGQEPAAERAAAENTVPAALAQAVRPANTKLIKTGEIASEVDDYASAVQQATAVLARFECFLADASTREGDGGALVGELVVRVAPEQFEPLFAALRAIGRVESEQVNTADVTAQFVDYEARIAALKLTESRLMELVKSKSFVDRMDDLLKVEQEMNRVRTEIEQLEGKLRVLSDRIALSTITLRLREPARIVPAAKLAIEVPVLATAADALNALLAELDGRLLSGQVTKREHGALAGEYRLNVMLDRFGPALAALTNLGRVDQREVTDWRKESADQPWAARVPCTITLTLFERAGTLPSGSLELQVGHLSEAMPRVREQLAAANASIAGNQTSKREDGSSVAKLAVRVPAGAFAGLAEQLGGIGRVIAQQLEGDAGEIRGGAADTPCTLSLTLAEPVRQIPSGGMIIEIANFPNARDRLSDLVAKHDIQVLASNSSQRTDGTWVGEFQLGISARAIDETVEAIAKLGKVSSREIRGIGLGALSRIDPQALGVIRVVLAEKAALTPEPDRASGSFRKYLRDGLAGLYDSLGMIAYGLIVMVPWLVVAVIAGGLIRRLWRKRKSQSATTKVGSAVRTNQ